MIFEKGNSICYGQDHAFWTGVPAGIEFETDYLGDGLIRLTAPNYGGDPCGSGSLYVRMNKIKEEIPPPKPKRKVKKAIEGFLRIFVGSTGNVILSDKLFPRAVGPGECIELPGRHCNFRGDRFVHLEYEVEE